MVQASANFTDVIVLIVKRFYGVRRQKGPENWTWYTSGSLQFAP